MRLDLQRRLALSLSGLALGVAALLAAALWLGHAALERALLDTVLQRELQVYLDADTPPQRIAVEQSGLALMRPARWPQTPLPAELAALAPGSHRDIALGDGHVHVLVRELAPGDRAYLTYDVSHLERREQQVELALAAMLLLTAMLSAWAGTRLARRLLRPLASVVARIAALQPERPAALAAQADDGELSVVIDAVNALLRELQALVARERAFAGAASHELRTPLASARIAAEMLAAQPQVPAEPLARMQRALHAATDTLDALLALSRGRESPPAQAIDLVQWLPRIAEPWAQSAHDHGTRLHWQLQPAMLLAAPSMLEVIFTNLLRNAIRATPGGSVRIEGDATALAVIDDGEGIDAEQLPHVFEPGTRGRHGGSGIGLYIARELAQRCGWRLTVVSTPGAGTAARLRFG